MDNLTDSELAALWRRQFEVYDDLVYGYMAAERERAAGRDPGPAAVTFGDLSGARHGLSVPRFYAHPGREEFKWSDPEFPGYVGRLEASLLRTRRELDARFE